MSRDSPIGAANFRCNRYDRHSKEALLTPTSDRRAKKASHRSGMLLLFTKINEPECRIRQTAHSRDLTPDCVAQDVHRHRHHLGCPASQSALSLWATVSCTSVTRGWCRCCTSRARLGNRLFVDNGSHCVACASVASVARIASATTWQDWKQAWTLTSFARVTSRSFARVTSCNRCGFDNGWSRTGAASVTGATTRQNWKQAWTLASRTSATRICCV